MTTNHLKTGVEPTPETSCISNISQTMGNVQHSVSIIRAMMEAASTSETSVNIYQTTWRNNPEDSHLFLATVRT
jgi:hypothetical protein